MITKYKLLKEYPGHTIGDIAVYTVMPEGKGHNTFQWENGTGIPLQFFPGTRSWWEKIEDEKNLVTYELEMIIQTDAQFKGAMYTAKTGNPRIYWTEVLRCIASDLNSKSQPHNMFNHSIVIDYFNNEGRVKSGAYLQSVIRQGNIVFNTVEDCQKAIDLLGENIKYLFND